MGIECSKDSVDVAHIDDLREETGFSDDEIRTWYRKFHEDCPAGQMNRKQFVVMYRKLFPDGDASQFAESVFRSFDRDGNGSIDFQEFLITIKMTSRGSIDEKLRWVFSLYDADGSGYVTKEELLDILEGMFKMKKNSCQMNMTPQQACDEVFDKLDQNNDQKLSKMEFIVGAKASPMMLLLLQTQTSE